MVGCRWQKWDHHVAVKTIKCQSSQDASHALLCGSFGCDILAEASLAARPWPMRGMISWEMRCTAGRDVGRHVCSIGVAFWCL